MNDPHKPDIDIIHLSGMNVKLLRLDRIHPEIPGNKWFKLKYNIEKVKRQGLKGIFTFGGAFSNHIDAVSAAGQESSIQTVGIIRGEETYAGNPTLSRAKNRGMKLIFISRSEYRMKNERSFIDKWKEIYPDLLHVPEGGSNMEGIRGASEIADLIPANTDIVCLPVGTGGTISGLIRSGLGPEIIGYPALRNTGFLEADIRSMSGKGNKNWRLINDYSEGGYAKCSERLLKCMKDIYNETGIKLDPIYTGKMILGLREDILKGRIAGNILAIHTGGIQGIEGMEQRLGRKLF